MSPLLSKDTNPSDLVWNKYVRVGEKIAYDDPRKDHAKIAKENNLGTPINDGIRQRLVDDAGVIRPTGEKICFEGHSSTCKIEGQKPKEKTSEVAQSLLGKERVY